VSTLEQAVDAKLTAAVKEGDQRQADARAALAPADNTNWRLSFGLGRRTTTEGNDQQ
jgi:hypothetical protein